MITTTIKNIPDSLYETLKRTAERNRRSINQQVIVSLEDALKKETVAELDQRIDEFRRSLGDVWITDEEINAAKRDGRK